MTAAARSDSTTSPSLLVEGSAEADPQGQLVEILSELEGNREAPVQWGELRRVVRAIQVTHSGPLPTPTDIERYDHLIPNGADRIMAMAEREQAHRHQMEEREQALLEQAERNDFIITKRGQAFGLGVCLAVLLAGIVLALAGHATVAAVLVGLDLVSLVAVFVAGRYLPGPPRPTSEPNEPADGEGEDRGALQQGD